MPFAPQEVGGVYLLLIACVVVLSAAYASLRAARWFEIRAACMREAAAQNRELTVYAVLEKKIAEAVGDYLCTVDGNAVRLWTRQEFAAAQEEAYERAKALAQSTVIYTGEPLLEAYASLERNASAQLRLAAAREMRKRLAFDDG